MLHLPSNPSIHERVDPQSSASVCACTSEGTKYLQGGEGVWIARQVHPSRLQGGLGVGLERVSSGRPGLFRLAGSAARSVRVLWCGVLLIVAALA